MASASCITIEEDGDDACSASKAGSLCKYFKRKSSKETAQCHLCNVSMKCQGSSTSGLIRHLRAKHNITFRKQSPEVPVSKPKSQQATTDKFRAEKSLEEVIAKMAAVDGIPFHVIENSAFIKTSLAAQGFKLSQRHGSAREQTGAFLFKPS